MDLKKLRQEIDLISQNPSYGAILGGLSKLAQALDELHPTKDIVDKSHQKHLDLQVKLESKPKKRGRKKK